MFRALFKQTTIYGIASILPRVLSFLLLPFYSSLISVATYGSISIIFSYFILFNIILSYGMETTFFRFFSKMDQSKKTVIFSTSYFSILFSTLLFVLITLLFSDSLSQYLKIDNSHVFLMVLILSFDALVVIPFVRLRIDGHAIKFSIYKLVNVCVNFVLNILFLYYLPNNPINGVFSYLNEVCQSNDQVFLILLSLLISSILTFLMFLPRVISQLKLVFDYKLYLQMLRYGFPVMIAGIAFAINESFDKLLLDKWLVSDQIKDQIGTYAACYKLAVFMTLFVTAFRLGVEPFLFNHSKNKNAKQTYATITKYFVLLAGLIMVIVCVYIDPISSLLLKSEAFREALFIVPLILLANLCMGVYNNLSVWYKLTDKTKFGAYISIFGAIVTLSMNYFLIPQIGILASALATLVAYSSMMLMSYVLGKQYYKVPYKIREIGFYLFLSIGISFVSFYVSYIRENLIFGTIGVFLYLTSIFVLERKYFKQLIKK